MKYLNKTLILFPLYIIIVPIDILAGENIKVGVATVDITPKEPIYLNGYGSKNKPSEWIVHPIHAKAIAFQDVNCLKAIIVTMDIIGFSREFAEDIANHVRDKLGISREQLMFTASHTHTAPLLIGANLIMYNLSEDELKTVSNYTEFLKDALFDVIKNSVLDLSPGSLSFGKGEANVAMNRRVFVKGKINFGDNPVGPTDPELPVLAAFDTEGNQKAILFGYACHRTTLTESHYQICGDYMGFAQEYLDLAKPGTTNLFFSGCGADANPYPRGTLSDARLNGMSIAGGVADVLRHKMKPVSGPIQCTINL